MFDRVINNIRGQLDDAEGAGRISSGARKAFQVYLATCVVVAMSGALFMSVGFEELMTKEPKSSLDIFKWSTPEQRFDVGLAVFIGGFIATAAGAAFLRRR